MQIPSIFYGKYNDVNKMANRFVTLLIKKKSIDEIISTLNGTYLSPNAYEIILNGPNPNEGSLLLFRLFVLPRLLINRIEIINENINYFINTLNNIFWGHLCISCRQNAYFFFQSETNRVTYLKQYFIFEEEYKKSERYFKVNEQAWLHIHKNTKSVLDHPDHIFKFILANLELFNKINRDNLNRIFYEHSAQDLIIKYKIREYVENYI